MQNRPLYSSTESGVMLKDWIQSSWQGFTVFLKDTSAGQMIASTSAWMLVFQPEPPCCYVAKPNRSTKTWNDSRALNNTGPSQVRLIRYFFINVLPATSASGYLNKRAARHFFISWKYSFSCPHRCRLVLIQDWFIQAEFRVTSKETPSWKLSW